MLLERAKYQVATEALKKVNISHLRNPESLQYGSGNDQLIQGHWRQGSISKALIKRVCRAVDPS